MLFQLKVYIPQNCTQRKKLADPADIRGIAKLVRKFNPPKQLKWNNCQVFYTRLGWQQFGLGLANKLTAQGYDLRICCVAQTQLKIAYQDRFQVLVRKETAPSVYRTRSIQRRVLRNQPKSSEEKH